jgi:hypothetical protein
MSSGLREKLKSELMDGTWDDLKDHAERGAVFVVSQDLDLLHVAEKVATDDASAVGAWIEGGSLIRPSEEQLKSWESVPSKSFRFIILQPYVLIQELGH